jgi:N-methylhydantoinase A
VSTDEGYHLAADIGGTFTDIVLEGHGRTVSRKVLTTAASPALGVLDGVDEVMAEVGVQPADVRIILHGTTLATNALIERKGAKTGFITTHGFRDILATGYEKRFDHYDLFIDHPPPVVPRQRRLGVRGRMAADGKEFVPLDEQGVEQIAHKFRDDGVEAVAIGFLHSYLNDTHERRAAAIVVDVLGNQATVCISSEVCPEIREYERFSTTATNAYVRPLMSGYLQNLSAGFEARGFAAPLYLMMSSGGLTTVDVAARLPIRLVESGPAGGAMLAGLIAKQCGLDEVLSFDMGGTTAKVCLLHNGEPERSRLFEVARTYRNQRGSGWPVRIPVIDMVEIGAGGGSIASVDSMGRINVGPHSAGSEPGPVSYGRGGSAPTVTDANLVLGRISPEHFAGGTMTLDSSAAAKALATQIGKPLSIDGFWPAAGVSEIVEENMANAARVHAIERGRTISHCTMIAFGGGAPLHAGRLAEKLGIKRILVPAGAGVGSAIGFLRAPLSFEVARSAALHLDGLDGRDGLDANSLNAALDDMTKQATDAIAPGLEGAAPSVRRLADCRYVGQGHEVSTPLPSGKLGVIHGAQIRADFEKQYEALYGLTIASMAVEIIALSVTVSTREIPVVPLEPVTPVPSPAPRHTRDVYEPALGRKIEMPVYWRFDCGPGVHIPGPAVIEENETSTIVPESFDATFDSASNIVLLSKGDCS